MNNQSITPNWYLAASDAKHTRQIVVDIPATNEIPPQVGALVPPGQSFAFTTQPWAAITLFMSVLSPNPGPFVFIRAEGFIDQFRHCPLRVAFCFYRMNAGGLFTVIVHVLCPSVEARTGNPAVFENHQNLDGEESPKLVSALIARDQVDVCFTASGADGPCTGYFGMATPLPAECRDALQAEWDQLVQYHHGISAARRSFPERVRQYEQENPIQDTPILPLQLNSQRFEAETVEEAQAAVATSGIAQEKIYDFEVTRNVQDVMSEGKGKSAEAAIEAAKTHIPSQAFDIQSGEIIQQGLEGVIEIQAQTETEAREQGKIQTPQDAVLETFKCDVQPNNGFLGIGKKQGLWKAYWAKPFKARIAYKLPAQVTVRYME